MNPECSKAFASGRQRGQSLAEFSAMLVALVPMFLVVPLMGKVADMNQATIQASRYAAWERTVAGADQKNEDQLAREGQRRFFSNVDAPIKTNEGFQRDERYWNVLWRDQNRRWLLANNGDASLETYNNDVPGSAARAVNTIMRSILTALTRLSGREPDLEKRGFYRGAVSVDVASNELKPFDRGIMCNGQESNDYFVCIQRHNVILTDTWSASSPDQVIERVQAMMPMALLGRFKSVTDTIGGIPILKEYRGFRPGYVAPDVIPADRLGGYEG